MNHRDLYTIDPAGRAQLARVVNQHGPLVLVDVLRGFLDAGGAARILARKLAAAADVTRIVTFDVDALIDYRSHRPAMTFENNEWTGYSEPYLAIDLHHDVSGKPFLVLGGMEPDAMWNRFVAAMLELVRELGVRLTVSLQGAPMNVPHTRPIGTSVHSVSEHIKTGSLFLGEMQVPGSASALLQYRLSQAGLAAGGIVVHVPHYLAALDYIPGAVAAMKRLQEVTGLELDPGDLEHVDGVDDQLLGQADKDSDFAALLETLEREYDARAQAQIMLPTADEIGQEVEEFLARHRDDQGGGG